MKQRFHLLLSFFLFFFVGCAHQNALTRDEQSDGWKLLFDGKTTTGWRGANQSAFPAQGWIVKDGILKGEAPKDTAAKAGDILTEKTYRDFELVFDWKLGKGGNSGVKYFIEERDPARKASLIGYEYQLIDDAEYIYNGKKLDEDFKTAAIYEVIPANKPDTKMGIWHRSKIIVKNNHIEHWLDGQKVVDVDRGSETFVQGVKDSKFKDYPGFSNIPQGHILLQDHGHSVSFRNIKIKEL